jgi:hypothetical protein
MNQAVSLATPYRRPGRRGGAFLPHQDNGGRDTALRPRAAGGGVIAPLRLSDRAGAVLLRVPRSTAHNGGSPYGRAVRCSKGSSKTSQPGANGGAYHGDVKRQGANFYATEMAE